MLRVLNQLLVIAVIWAIFCGITYALHPQARIMFAGGAAAVPQEEGEISLADAKRLATDGKSLWVDVRPAAEFARDHVPGAENVPADEPGALETKLFEWTSSGRLMPDTVIIVYCASSGCGTSHQLRKVLATKNPSLHVSVLAGGWTEWKRGESTP
jgi:rhodanese-related sulfurtransferase